MSNPSHTGQCLCGDVRFEVRGTLRDVIGCHCEQCRRTSGHFVAATACLDSELTMIEQNGLSWYQSSPNAQRGFCHNCGSSLFWKNSTRDNISIMAGAIDQPSGLQTSHHIFVSDAADYYTIDDGTPVFEQDAGKDNRGI